MTSDSLSAARHDGGDRFLALFLMLSMEGRRLPQRAAERQVRELIAEFFAWPSVRDASPDAVAEELTDAAASYFQTCLTDNQYTSAMFGLRRLNAQEVRGKIARDFATTVAAVVASGTADGIGAPLLPALLAGLRQALGDGADELARTAVAKDRAASQAAATLWGEAC
ncbi:MAG: hypothetical protein Q4D79_03300 [Propionibacteriaceae bacterium]|nr:hypothetical protein [Propionibacteriaceae bacterium]